MMLTRCLTSLIVFLAALGSVRAEWWTNQAGQVIEARLASFDGVGVTLARTNGTLLRLPLSALCDADQRRVRLQSAQSVAPDFVRAAYTDARSILDRFERLPKRQQTPEARKRAIRMAHLAFDARVKTRAAEIKDKAVWDEVRRLRASLENPPQE